MSLDQQLGQWVGVTTISVMVGAILFGFVQIALSVRDYFRRREFYIEAARKMGEHVARMTRPAQNLTVGGRIIREHRDRNGVRIVEALELTEVNADPYQLGDLRLYGDVQKAPSAGPFEFITASPPCEPMVRASGFPPMAGSFRRGEHPVVIVAPSRRGMKTEDARRLKSLWDLAHERPYSTPAEAMLLGFSGGRNGEIAIGARLDFERSVMDGDRPSSIEPRGIFSQ